MRVGYRWSDESELIAKDFVQDEFVTPTVPHPHLLPSMLTCYVMGCEQTLIDSKSSPNYSCTFIFLYIQASLVPFHEIP